MCGVRGGAWTRTLRRGLLMCRALARMRGTAVKTTDHPSHLFPVRRTPSVPQEKGKGDYASDVQSHRIRITLTSQSTANIEKGELHRAFRLVTHRPATLGTPLSG